MAVIIDAAGWFFYRMRVEMLAHPVGAPLLFVFGAISSEMMMLAFPFPRSYIARLRAH